MCSQVALVPLQRHVWHVTSISWWWGYLKLESPRTPSCRLVACGVERRHRHRERGSSVAMSDHPQHLADRWQVTAATAVWREGLRCPSLARCWPRQVGGSRQNRGCKCSRGQGSLPCCRKWDWTRHYLAADIPLLRARSDRGRRRRSRREGIQVVRVVNENIAFRSIGMKSCCSWHPLHQNL